MRSEQEMLDLIINTAREDQRVRAVILNGSRANPHARRDLFQDYDVVYIVTEIASFKKDPDWIRRFGELMILQLPDEMQDPPPDSSHSYAYLMQYTDGNRIDLSLFPQANLPEMEEDSLSVVLLDKDGIIGPLAPASESSYLPIPPTAKAFADCCNEFWWVCPYVAKGLWRQEITYARNMLDEVVRAELMKILRWHIGVETQFMVNPGKLGKYFEQFLEPGLWELLLKTYADAGYENTWQALFSMCDLFEQVAVPLAEHFGFTYPQGDAGRVRAHLQHVKLLPRDAREIY